MNNLLFDNWEAMGRALIATLLAYITLLIMVRVSGKRTLSKMNAYDFLVTIALGSCLAATALNKSVALAEGAVVYMTLISLQFIITWSSVRSSRIKQLVSGSPTLLLYKGKILEHAMKKERITIEEMYVVARRKGLENLDKAFAVVLETTGDLTIMPNMDRPEPQTLDNVIPSKYEQKMENNSND